MKKPWNDYVRELMAISGKNQNDIADAMGKTQGAIGHWLTGRRTPNFDDVAQILKILGAEKVILNKDGTVEDFDVNVTPVRLRSHKVPLISYVQAGMWTDINLLQDSEDFEYILTDLDVSENAFALKIKGDSMEPDFIEGDVIIVDPKIQPHAGEFVVAVNGDYEATFKKYRPLQDYDNYGNRHFELVPLNPDYDKLTTLKQAIRIVGTMVEHRIYRRKR
ncbi:LexA family protein [Lonepinella koalarum]|uniref:SOS-response transcriptional repressor LexA n=1 Tax=Lonepinella koalarum TaxID=53417 RepID=A0A4R1KXI6_9PAST|nr:S24 family peptidase [Lonepinella koalarum]MDH2925567.1 heme-binding protein [Lonepinella koalarum]MDH2927255.1 heme-binding protein [Lonepinella koalarum]MDH2927929.1 heme-binding protein [Lonepinella koalarum]TCK70126.1 SOS-response transcriptional repressor LexA [Lonepinella koalarum]TFJ90280.1 helix-turn-helix domain-containing protein [Lonepinella koalarum]